MSIGNDTRLNPSGVVALRACWPLNIENDDKTKVGDASKNGFCQMTHHTSRGLDQQSVRWNYPSGVVGSRWCKNASAMDLPDLVMFEGLPHLALPCES